MFGLFYLLEKNTKSMVQEYEAFGQSFEEIRHC